MKRGILLAVGLCVVCAFTAELSAETVLKKATGKLSTLFSKEIKGGGANADSVRIDLSELTLEENLSIPEPGKQAKKIRAVQSREVKRLQKARLADLKLVRDNEVVKATISAASLFLPNDTVLNDKADLYLRPFLQDLRLPGYYHVMLVMHSDDTGSEAYCLDLTRARVAAVQSWFARNGGNVDYMVAYEAGPFEPVATNRTMEGRARNRRLEIYLIPGEKMIEMAQRGELD